jgi:ribosomal protein S18 acetylase RimI-like enzyme
VDGSLGTSSGRCEDIHPVLQRFIGLIFPREEESSDGEPPHGHVTSISVLRSYRRLGLAKKLMVQSRAPSNSFSIYLLTRCSPEEAMANVHRAAYVSLHVRKSNRAALGLYKDTLGFSVKDIEKKYCASDQICARARALADPRADADGEDAYAMQLLLS